MELLVVVVVALGAVAIAVGHLYLTYRNAAKPVPPGGCGGGCAGCGMSSLAGPASSSTCGVGSPSSSACAACSSADRCGAVKR